MRIISAIFLILSLLSVGCTIGKKEEKRPDDISYQDMHNGIFISYTYVGKPYQWGCTTWVDGSEVSSLDELADNLDVEDLAEVAYSARAQYVIFTVFHANMQVLFPSKVMDKWLSGHFSRRDAVGELIKALKSRNIRTILYFHPSDNHDLNEEDQMRTGGNDTLPRVRWNDFVNELMSEVLDRYGKDISGFLIDGGLPEYVDAARLRKTIKDYNPDLWIIQNAGLNPLCADYAAVENRIKPPYPSTDWMMMQVISNDWWAEKDGVVIDNPEFAYRYTVLQAAVSNRMGGGVAWSFGPYPDGRWELGMRSFCRELGLFLDKAGKSLFDTQPSKSWLTGNGQPLLGTQYVATESKDGNTTYLHVFIPPRGKTLQLPQPADGKRFSSAKLFNGGNVVDILQNDNGITLTLGENDRWDDIDTIIEIV